MPNQRNDNSSKKSIHLYARPNEDITQLDWRCAVNLFNERCKDVIASLLSTHAHQGGSYQLGLLKKASIDLAPVFKKME